jgi:hypothetical protein
MLNSLELTVGAFAMRPKSRPQQRDRTAADASAPQEILKT